MSAEVGVDVTATDIVYGYLKGATEKPKEVKKIPFYTDTTAGNAVIGEVVKTSADVGVDGTKAGTGFGSTRIICAAVGAGAF